MMLKIYKKLFNEIKSKIKLDDTSLKFKDKNIFIGVKQKLKGIMEKD